MKQVILQPSAAALISSLRAIGYTFDAAMADIVDNSISANAKTIWITLNVINEPYLAILDNGHGMDEKCLLDAMKHGGVGPSNERGAGDLGRYGLGLKTASMSQCRCLTVVTLRNGQLNGAEWDLDLVEASNEWTLRILSPSDLERLPIEGLQALESGTLVIWSGFDRVGAGDRNPAVALEQAIDRSREHLSMVFHRFLSEEPPADRLKIFINGLAVEAKEPFISKNPKTERLPKETVNVDGTVVTIQPYILPHLSAISVREMELAGGLDGLRRHQGFYIYRSRRLITEGTWFRLLPLDDLNKLARVQVDIPNSLDRFWDLDVKKSTARPPEAVRETFRRIVDRISARSKNVFRERRRRSKTAITHLWLRERVREGAVYSINRNHPSIIAVRRALTDVDELELECALKMLELALPVDAIFSDMASDKPLERSDEEVQIELMAEARRWLSVAGDDQAEQDRIIAALPVLEPFSMYPALTRTLVAELKNA